MYLLFSSVVTGHSTARIYILIRAQRSIIVDAMMPIVRSYLSSDLHYGLREVPKRKRTIFYNFYIYGVEKSVYYLKSWLIYGLYTTNVFYTTLVTTVTTIVTVTRYTFKKKNTY